jgi:hypothetical protein
MSLYLMLLLSLYGSFEANAWLSRPMLRLHTPLTFSNARQGLYMANDEMKVRLLSDLILSCLFYSDNCNLQVYDGLVYNCDIFRDLTNIRRRSRNRSLRVHLRLCSTRRALPQAPSTIPRSIMTIDL